jgi:phage terminase large subunit-like protein
MALEDPEWMSKKYGCWTEETKNLPLDQQESSWPQRYPSDVVRNEKRAAIKRNQLSIFLREKECKLVSPETATFKEDWLRYYDVLPEHMSTVLAIDPVPPPSPQQVASGMANKDYEVLLVMGASGPDYYLLDVIAHRGHVPSWTITQFFQMAEKWRPGKVRVEGTQYQRTLSWLLKNAMEERRQYYVIDDLADNRNKVTRITDSYSGPCSNGHFYVKKEHTEFIAQFIEYPDVSHDDILDAGAMAITALTGMGQTIDSLNSIMKEEEEIDDLVYSRGAP